MPARLAPEASGHLADPVQNRWTTLHGGSVLRRRLPGPRPREHATTIKRHCSPSAARWHRPPAHVRILSITYSSRTVLATPLRPGAPGHFAGPRPTPGRWHPDRCLPGWRSPAPTPPAAITTASCPARLPPREPTPSP